MGFRNPVRRSTLADANETRDWRIYAEFAQRLIGQTRRLYAGDSVGVDLDNTAWLRQQQIENVHVVQFSLGNMDETGNAASQVKQSVHLHGCLGAAEVPKETQTG